jgi:hypothetical protein
MSINTLFANPTVLSELANLIPQPTPSSALSIVFSATTPLSSVSSTSPILLTTFSLDFSPSETLFFLITVSCASASGGYANLQIQIGASTALNYSIPLNTISTNNTCFFTYIPPTASSSSVQVKLIPASQTLTTTISDNVSVIVFQQITNP